MSNPGYAVMLFDPSQKPIDLNEVPASFTVDYFVERFNARWTMGTVRYDLDRQSLSCFIPELDSGDPDNKFVASLTFDDMAIGFRRAPTATIVAFVRWLREIVPHEHPMYFLDIAEFLTLEIRPDTPEAAIVEFVMPPRPPNEALRTEYIVHRMIATMLSGHAYVLKGRLSTETEARIHSWSSQRETAVHWLASEMIRMKAASSWSNPYYLEEAIDYESDRFLFYATDRITKAVAEIEVPDLTRGEVRLYFYMRWLVATIDGLKHLANDGTIRPDPLPTSPTLGDLRSLVAYEISEIEKLGSGALQESADAVSRELVEFWKHRITII